MRTNKTITYALACLKELAKQIGEYVQVSEIARNQSMPAAYCQKILMAMSRAHLIESTKGRGFQLLKPADQISTLEVIQALAATDATDKTETESYEIRVINEILSSRVNKALSDLSVAEAVRA